MSSPSVASRKNQTPSREDDQPDDERPVRPPSPRRARRRRPGRRRGGDGPAAVRRSAPGRPVGSRQAAVAATSGALASQGSACAWCRSDRGRPWRVPRAGRAELLRRDPRHRSPVRLESTDRPRSPGAGDDRRPGAPESPDGGMSVADTAEIGVFGGSGFYSLLDDVREIKVDTPYGAAVGLVLPRRRRRPQGRVPAAPRPPPHDPAAPDQLPGQRLGDALARGQGRHLAVRGRLAPARGQARRLRRVRPVRRPDLRPRRHVLRRPDRDPPLVGRHLRPGPAAARDRRRSATTASRSTNAARSSSSRARASRRRPSRSGSATPAGRSST